MKMQIKSWLAILMGIIIAIADLAWLFDGSTYDMTWVAFAVVIFIADVVWLYIDYSMMKK